MHRSWLSGASDEEGSASEGRVPSPPASDTESGSLLDTVLLAEWEDRAEQGLFRYDVTACPTKVVPGAYGFVAQCNEGRGSKKRPTEFRVDKVRCSHVLLLLTTHQPKLASCAPTRSERTRACHEGSGFMCANCFSMADTLMFCTSD